MAVDKLVDSTQLDSDLTSVANAIRTKGGTSAQLAFPAGFVSAIDAIPTGGGAAWDLHTVQITLAADTPMSDILHAYIDKCASWLIYPSDSENTSLNTIASGQAFSDTLTGATISANQEFLGTITTPTGVVVPQIINISLVNDVTYNVVRTRGNVNKKPAGSYILVFYGVSK